ncbi:hypothetical protein [uncultured Imperialibacter sp.]|uniref:hypothetical protein n=1 Tax=uncultured Imperialibacter sp. TaxID=1672639 RepID=UPI0030D8CB22|tara:strand:- start:19209 stop:19739 length:531 start_codon:yes stop_codon:yes gene_type:complete
MAYFKLNFILLLTLMMACQQKDNNQELQIDFFDEQLMMRSNKPILNIYCHFDECGEWGGHEEFIEITKKNKSFLLTHTEYSVNCDSMVSEYYLGGLLTRPYKELVGTSTFELTEAKKRAILNFSTDMVESKFSETFPGYSGITLSLFNSDSTLFIRTYTRTAEHYLNLITALKQDE